MVKSNFLIPSVAIFLLLPSIDFMMVGSRGSSRPDLSGVNGQGGCQGGKMSGQTMLQSELEII